MNKRSKAGSAALLACALVVLVGVPPAAAVTYYGGARSCNYGYDAQNSSYHRAASTHFQYTGGTWHSQWHPSNPGWGYDWSGAGTQSFSNSKVEGYFNELSSVVSTRCV